MNKRGLSHALDHHAVGELDEAAHFADDLYFGSRRSVAVP